MRGLRVVTIAVLTLLGIGGLAGGVGFLTDRTGGRLGMSVDELPSWPLLGDYTAPGVVLVLLFGVLPLVSVWLLVRRSRGGWALTTAVGLLLVAWMAVEIVAIGLSFPALQTALLIVGILLTGLGLDGAERTAADEFRDAVPS